VAAVLHPQAAVSQLFDRHPFARRLQRRVHGPDLREAVTPPHDGAKPTTPKKNG
jgi:hypothetical protein